MDKIFITKQMRAQDGQFTRVADGAMYQAGIERMGYCQACGHEIDKHFGVKSPDGVYYWVGSECLRILTGKSADVEASAVGTRYTKNGSDWVNVGRDYIENALSYMYKTGRDKYGACQMLTPLYNELVYSILRQAINRGRTSGEFTLSVKQLGCVERWASKNNIKLQ